MPHPLRLLIEQLAQEQGRLQAAQSLADAIGGQHLLLFIRDSETQLMVPAPGMTKTLAGGPSWRELLRQCVIEARVHAEVDVLGRRWHASALAQRGCALVLLGDRPCNLPDEIVEALPLLAEVLRAQQALRIGMAEAMDAREAAARARQLAIALDGARAATADLNQQLRVEHQRKDEFLAMLAHELRNPLAPVMTGIEILRRIAPDNLAARERQIAVMLRNMQQLTHLVDDLLDVSRVSRGLIELRREVLSLGDVLSAAIEACKPVLVSRGHALVQGSRLEDGLHVSGDRVRLVQVFSNLLMNAAKYTNPGGRIEIDVRQEGTSAQACVRDNGAGIPADMLESIFEMFTQVPGSLDRAPGGLGIGLTLVRTLVGLHGGRVAARSPGPGQGSEFIVTLPLVDAPPSVEPSGSARPSQQWGHVLVVDDNLDAAQTLAEVLRMAGAQVSVAHDGSQALEVAASGGLPDVVLLDIGLPGMDGYETAREWRRRFGSGSRLVALTGYGGAEDRRRTASSGFDAHLVKPVSLEAIEAVLRSLQQEAPHDS